MAEENADFGFHRRDGDTIVGGIVRVEDDKVHGSEADTIVAMKDVAVEVLLEAVVVVGDIVKMGKQSVGMTMEAVFADDLIAVFSMLDNTVAPLPVVHDEFSGLVAGKEVNGAGDAVFFIADAPLGSIGDRFPLLHKAAEIA